MVKHMIIWKMKDGEFDKKQRALEIKTALEGLEGKIEGLVKCVLLPKNSILLRVTCLWILPLLVTKHCSFIKVTPFTKRLQTA